MEIAIWLVAALLLLVGEALTLAFVALYFGLAALAAAIAAAGGANVFVQVLVFAIVSILSLVGTRGVLSRLMQRTPLVQSNAQTIVGERGVVTVPLAAQERPGPDQGWDRVLERARRRRGRHR